MMMNLWTGKQLTTKACNRRQTIAFDCHGDF